MSRGFRDEDGDAGDPGSRAFERDREQALENVGSTNIAVVVKRPSATGKAIEVDDGTKRLWVPCALLRERVDHPNGSSTITVPLWFAKKEGLI